MKIFVEACHKKNEENLRSNWEMWKDKSGNLKIFLQPGNTIALAGACKLSREITPMTIDMQNLIGFAFALSQERKKATWS